MYIVPSTILALLAQRRGEAQKSDYHPEWYSTNIRVEGWSKRDKIEAALAILFLLGLLVAGVVQLITGAV
jgi:hypothetical protein